MPRLARRIAGPDGVLDAAVIGAAETLFKRDPETWRDWGSPSDVLQQLKQLWHVLVHFGRPARTTGSPT
jgi:DNA phosphorothioation-dependent restriction protein DptG